mgnify:CR=1 FL=1
MQGRLAKKLTQAQLAQQINERPQVVQEYESGKAIPNQQIRISAARSVPTFAVALATQKFWLPPMRLWMNGPITSTIPTTGDWHDNR